MTHRARGALVSVSGSQVHGLALPGDPGGSSMRRTLINLICYTTGAGTFGVSIALARMGWPGVAILVIAAGANWYTGLLLHRCHQFTGIAGPAGHEQVLRTGLIVGDTDERGRGEKRGFEDLAKISFGNIARTAVTMLTYANQVGIAVLYLILAGDNMLLLTNPTGMTPVFPGSRSARSDLRLWIVCMSACMLLILLQRNLRHVALTSLLGAMALILCVACLVGNAATDHGPLVDHSYGTTSVRNFAVGCAAMVFAFSGHPVFPVLQSAMQKPAEFPVVLGFAYSFLFIILGVVAIVGYYVYGRHVAPNVLRDLGSGSLRTTATILATLHLFTATPVVLQPAILALEKYFLRHDLEDRMVTFGCDGSEVSLYTLGSAGLRFALLTCVTCLAIAVPYFGAVMSLLGATTVTGFSLFLPICMYCRLYWEQIHSLEKLLCAVLLVFGIFVCVGGTVGACIQMHHLSQNFTFFEDGGRDMH